jgi:simple sugar transport system permease protein
MSTAATPSRAPLAPAPRRALSPLWVTAAIFALLFATASVLYDGFFSTRLAVNLIADNAFLLIAALGMTLVIISGGIDLSVGSMIGFASIFSATLIGAHGVALGWAWIAVLAVGALSGATMGALIHVFRLPAFLVTLAGLFFLRGAAFWLNTDSVGITHPWYEGLSGYELALGPVGLPASVLIALTVLVLAYVIAHHLRWGRNLFALGGSEQSATLMGLPVGATRIGVYTLNGVCAALAGIVSTLYTGSGNPSMGTGLELDAIAVVVIGGTLLRGGRGHVFGTLLGVLIYGTIQAAILFDGRLNSWWMRIVVGVLLLVFVLLQRVPLRLPGRKRDALSDKR